MTRPVDTVIEFLEAEQARGVSHVLLDEETRDGLRELLFRTRAGKSSQSVPDTATPPTNPTHEGH